MILLMHAYSRNNSGDGLLVDLALKLIADAFGKDMPVTVVASDAESFPDLSHVLQVPGPSEKTAVAKVLKVLGNTTVMLSGAMTGKMNFMDLNKLLPQTTLIVGVGGAYLRAGSVKEGLITTAVQLPQLMWAVRTGKPTFYLPQSIGPLKEPFGTLLRSQLKHLNHLSVRDDRTKEELGSQINAHRCPDMALLEIGQKVPSKTDGKPFSKVYLVARELNRSPEICQAYRQKLQRLRELIPHAEPVVQSRGRGNNDVAFYESMGWGTCRDVKTALKEDGPGVMISVRLHGALEAMLQGCPTVHLTYERKGFGAYDDLGIRPYLHTAAGFDPEVVAAQVKELAAGAPFWSLIAKKLPDIQASYTDLKTRMRQQAGL